MNIAIFASGQGSNFEAIARAIKRGYIKAQLKLLVTDKENAFVRVRAKKFGVRDVYVNPKCYPSRLAFDKAIIRILEQEDIDAIILAGFMRIVTPYFVKRYNHRIINIHPALLPAFRGERAIERAFACGRKVTGVTVHFVDEKVDHGPIILQKKVTIKAGTSLARLTAAIHKIEHILYPRAVKLLAENRITIKNRHVTIR
ncbi:MAG: phosphoribosylglycinamide formyltransferase [Candidatus Omnitrophota bacterium]